MKVHLFTAIALLGVLLMPAAAHAQDNDFLSDKPTIVKKKSKKKKGWYPMLKTSGTVAWSNSKDVVGQMDGSTWNLGYILTGQLIYLSKSGHEWKNDLGWQLNYIKTPLVDAFSKALDNFEISSAWLYHIPKIDWMGPYGQFGLKSSLLPGAMINAGVNPLNVTYVDSKGVPTGRTAVLTTSESLDITKAFSPTILKESFGLFVNPFKKKYANLYVQAGAGAWEIFGRNGYITADDSATADQFEIKAVDDTVQVGAEVNLSVTGSLKKMFTYGFKANFMLPFYNNSNTSLSGMDLLNSDIEFKAGVKLSKYVSIDYSFKAVKMPLVSDKWQIQNGLVLTFNATLVDAPKDPKKLKVKMCPCPKKEGADAAKPVDVKPADPAKAPAEKPSEETKPVEVKPADPAAAPEEKPSEETKPVDVKPAEEPK